MVPDAMSPVDAPMSSRNWRSGPMPAISIRHSPSSFRDFCSTQFGTFARPVAWTPATATRSTISTGTKVWFVQPGRTAIGPLKT